jgi:predicted nuclease with TOPRIM domain
MDKIELLTLRGNQLSALQSARDQIAAIRTERLTQKEGCSNAVEVVNLELKRFHNERAILKVQCKTIADSMQTLADTWLGREIPEFIRKQIGEKQAAIDGIGHSLAHLDKTSGQLTEMRDRRRAQLQLAEESLTKAESELKQVDDRIAEIRGF